MKKVLLLEGVHQSAVDNFSRNKFTVTRLKTSPSPSDLLNMIGDYEILGIRSRTQITEKVLENAKKLITIGCFCIGTNQVDLQASKLRGIPVFNAPYSNTRSVAELVIGEIIMLFRQMSERQIDMHQGIWKKTSSENFEVRGKKLGIVGYGHIGSQVAILAEAMGMNVYYYDIKAKLPIGNAKPVMNLPDMLSECDVITLHVPQDPSTKNMFDAKTIARMKQGSYLINAARGNVVDIEALCSALDNKHLKGAAIDVFPSEPKSNNDPFISELSKYKNTILTPHVGGSTEESQLGIGQEVSQKTIDFFNSGVLDLAVNFPGIALPEQQREYCRYIHIHYNKPGILREINEIFLAEKINVLAQYLNTDSLIGYVVTDIKKHDDKVSLHVLNNLLKVKGTLSCRLANFF